MRLRLRLGYWPPVASHLLCFFLGVGLVNLTQTPTVKAQALGKGQFYVALSDRLRLAAKAFPDGFYLGRKAGVSGGNLCRDSNILLRVEADAFGATALVGVPASVAGLAVLRKFVGPSVPELIGGKESTPMCQVTPQISFGRS